MDDLISRQAAIDAVEESRRENHHEGGKEACCHEYEHRHFLKILHELPSAQPEIANNLYLYKCYITDEDGLQHEVIHTGDIKRVTGWEI